MDARMTSGQESRFIAKLCEGVAEELRDRLEYRAKKTAQQYESPIEAAFSLAWYAFKWMNDSFFALLSSQVEVQAGGNNYRLDFALVDKPHNVYVAIELDGHEFHERTPEQVDRRNQRDADLQSAGWVVLHFSGRQILGDPFQCINNVYDAVIDCVNPPPRKG